MWVRLSACAAVILVLSLGGALAETSCEDVKTDLTGKNLFGQHTMQELSAQARAGNCGAAAYLTRRARDAAGYVNDHCPSETELRSLAETMIRLGQSILSTSECEN